MRMKTLFMMLLIVIAPFANGHGVNNESAPRVSAGIALWEFFNDQDIHALHLSYEFAPLDNLYEARPTLMLINAEGGYHHISFGLSKEFNMADSFYWGVGSQVGFIDSSRLLGHKVEFYSRVYMGYRLSARDAITVEVGHISNAGLGRYNPGSESFVIAWQRAVF